MLRLSVFLLLTVLGVRIERSLALIATLTDTLSIEKCQTSLAAFSVPPDDCGFKGLGGFPFMIENEKYT